MKKLSIVSIFLLCLYSNSNAQTFDTVWANEFQTVLDKAVKDYNVKGASMAVYFPGQGYWTGVSGISSPDVPITADMRFGIGSNSKLFLTVAMLKLQEEGILSLDDPLYKWLPPINNVDSTITIRQLLSHQSGIFDYLDDNLPIFYDSVWQDTSRIWTYDDIFKTIGAPHFSPGHGCRYSNTGYIIAGIIVEKATGKTWQKILREYILDPLQMENTFIALAEEPNGPIAHEWLNETVEITSTPMTAEFSLIGAAGSMFSTPSELIEWYRTILNDNFLNPTSFQELMVYEPSGLATISFLRIYYNNRLNYYFIGGTFGYTTPIRYDVNSKSLMCIFINGCPADLNWVNFFNLFNNTFYNNFPKKPHDAEISKISNLPLHNCSTSIKPSITLKNAGINPLTSVNVNYRIDSGNSNTFNWTGLLNTGETVSVVIPELSTDEGSHLFTCYSSNPNGETEGYNFNDTAKINFVVCLSPVTVLNEDFEGPVFPPNGWAINSVSKTKWPKCSLSSYSGNFSAARANYLFDGAGEYDIETPIIDLSSISNPVLSFQYAYTDNIYHSTDKLNVSVSTDSSKTWNTLKNNSGSSLRTVDFSGSDFYPQGSSEWKQDFISLAGYEGEAIIRFRFTCLYRQNMFIDDVKIEEGNHIEMHLVGKRNISIFPNPASCQIQLTSPITSSHTNQLEVFDYTGRQVLTQTLPPLQQGETVTIDLSNQRAGIYLVRLNMGGEEFSGKVLLVK